MALIISSILTRLQIGFYILKTSNPLFFRWSDLLKPQKNLNYKRLREFGWDICRRRRSPSATASRTLVALFGQKKGFEVIGWLARVTPAQLHPKRVWQCRGEMSSRTETYAKELISRFEYCARLL